MRSWSKCVIFSCRMKSSSSDGPRTPALSELWLSGITTPSLVVIRFSGPWLNDSSCLCLAAAPSPIRDLRWPSCLDCGIRFTPVPIFLSTTRKRVRHRRNACAGDDSARVQFECGVEDIRQRSQRGGAGRAGCAPDQPFGHYGQQLHVISLPDTLYVGRPSIGKLM